MCTGRPTHTPGEEATTPAYRAARHGHRCRRAVLALALVATLAAAGPDAADPPYGNAVTHWNAVASEVFVPTQGTNPLAQSRTFAILHAAVQFTTCSTPSIVDSSLTRAGSRLRQTRRWTRPSLLPPARY